MMVAVGFNPRWGKGNGRVAERRLNGSSKRGFQSSLRDESLFVRSIRGLKPPATKDSLGSLPGVHRDHSPGWPRLWGCLAFRKLNTVAHALLMNVGQSVQGNGERIVPLNSERQPLPRQVTILVFSSEHLPSSL